MGNWCEDGFPTNSQAIQTQNIDSDIYSQLVEKHGDNPHDLYAIPISTHFPLSKQAQQTLKNLVENNQQENQRLPQLTQPIYQIKHISASYQGNFKKGSPDGQGIVHYRDGSFYYGFFVDGKAQGKGMYIFSNGSFYQGGFKQSKFHGYGALCYLGQKMRFMGQFSQGKPHGQGKQIYEDNSSYTGQFNQGVKQGPGQYRWANGLSYQGNFKQGLMEDDHGKLIYKNKVIYQGKFYKGVHDYHRRLQ